MLGEGGQNFIMNISERTSSNKAEIDEIETRLKTQGYKQVAATQKLKPYEYYRNEFSGTAKSFEGSLNYHIEWCKPE